MYILDNTIWFLSFVFLDFNPISLLAKQLSIKFNCCCTEGKIPAYLKKTIVLSIKKKLNLIIPFGNRVKLLKLLLQFTSVAVIK